VTRALINAFRVSLQPFATAKCGQFCFLFPQQKAFAALQGFLTPPKGDFPRGLATKGASEHLDAHSMHIGVMPIVFSTDIWVPIWYRL